MHGLLMVVDVCMCGYFHIVMVQVLEYHHRCARKLSGIQFEYQGVFTVYGCVILMNGSHFIYIAARCGCFEGSFRRHQRAIRIYYRGAGFLVHKRSLQRVSLSNHKVFVFHGILDLYFFPYGTGMIASVRINGFCPDLGEVYGLSQVLDIRMGGYLDPVVVQVLKHNHVDIFQSGSVKGEGELNGAVYIVVLLS